MNRCNYVEANHAFSYANCTQTVSEGNSIPLFMPFSKLIFYIYIHAILIVGDLQNQEAECQTHHCHEMCHVYGVPAFEHWDLGHLKHNYSASCINIISTSLTLAASKSFTLSQRFRF
jgi:hypothetical protein